MMSGLLFYVQANPLIGTSHLLRSLDLARQWKSKGSAVHYVVGQLPATLLRKIAISGCEIIKPDGPLAADELACSLWEFADKHDCEWLATDDSRQDLVRSVAAAKNESKSYLVLGNAQAELAGAISMASNHDPSFSLVRPNPTNQPLPKVAPKRASRRVTIDLCRIDGEQSAEFVRQLCQRFKSTSHLFDIVTPFATAAANQLHEQQHPMRHRMTWHRNSDRIFAALFLFDLVVTADPACFFETAHCGIPSLLMDSEGAHSKRYEGLASLTASPWWFASQSNGGLQIDAVCEQIQKLVKSPKSLATHSTEMSRLVDDQGAKRLVAAMENMKSGNAGNVKSA